MRIERSCKEYMAQLGRIKNSCKLTRISRQRLHGGLLQPSCADLGYITDVVHNWQQSLLSQLGIIGSSGKSWIFLACGRQQVQALCCGILKALLSGMSLRATGRRSTLLKDTAWSTRPMLQSLICGKLLVTLIFTRRICLTKCRYARAAPVN